MGGKEHNEYMKQYIFKAAEIFVNILMVLSALGAVVAIAYIIPESVRLIVPAH